LQRHKKNPNTMLYLLN